MTKKLLYVTLVAALAAVAVVAFALPAGAAQRTFKVRLATGNVITVTVDAPCVPMDQVPGLPGTPVEDLTPSSVCPPATQTPPPGQPQPGTPTTPQTGTNPGQPPSNNSGSGSGSNHSSGGNPSSHKGHKQGRTRSHAHATPNTDPQAQAKARKKKRRSDGVPTPHNPTFFDALPGPATTGVPNFVIEKFKVPIFLLPLYQAAGIQYVVRWEVLAAINEIETDYGRNLNVSSAGAVGWMQFIPSTWKLYGTDGNGDGKADPFNPVDAIFTAAR